jgi:hypothetical protein
MNGPGFIQRTLRAKKGNTVVCRFTESLLAIEIGEYETF